MTMSENERPPSAVRSGHAELLPLVEMQEETLQGTCPPIDGCYECSEWYHANVQCSYWSSSRPPCDVVFYEECENTQKAGEPDPEACVWDGDHLLLWCQDGYWWALIGQAHCKPGTCQEAFYWVYYFRTASACPAGEYTIVPGQTELPPTVSDSIVILSGDCSA